MTRVAPEIGSAEWFAEPLVEAAREGLTIERIAELFGCSERLVKSILHVHAETKSRPRSEMAS